MLFQDSTTTKSGLTIKNMTNDGLSKKAVAAIGREIPDSDASVEMLCTHSGKDSEFDVISNDIGIEPEYLFSVTNSGVTYNR